MNSKNHEFTKRTVMIFGVSGFLGSNLAVFFEELGDCQVVGVSRSRKPIWLSTMYHQETSFSLESLRKVMHRYMPSLVINCLAVSDHEKCEESPQLAEFVNTKLAISLAQVTQEVDAKFVQISTDAVFSGCAQDAPYSEDDLTKPFSTYGKTKLQGELGVLSVAKESIVSRVNFFGWSPDGKKSILEFFLRELQLGNKINGYTDFIVTSEYVGRLCSDLNDLIQIGFGGIIHLSSLDSVSKYDFGVLVANAFNLDSSLINPVTASTFFSEATVSRSRNLALDSNLASRILGRQRPSQENGITEARMNAKKYMKKFGIDENDWRRKI